MSRNNIKLMCMAESEISNLNYLLSIPGAVVLAVGPPSCVRQLYFAAQSQNQQDNFYMYVEDEKKLTMGMHLQDIKKVIDKLLIDEPKILICYLSCLDLLIGSDFDNIIEELQQDTKTYVIQFKRGPLEKRKIKPKAKIRLILSDLINQKFFSLEEEKLVVDILEELENE